MRHRLERPELEKSGPQALPRAWAPPRARPGTIGAGHGAGEEPATSSIAANLRRPSASRGPRPIEAGPSGLVGRELVEIRPSREMRPAPPEPR
jgi:hypothetical protein